MREPFPAVHGSVGPLDGISRFQEGGEGRPGCVADVEACPRAAQVAFLPPADVSFHLIFRIESLAFNQAFGKAEGHGGVVGPLAGFEVERAATDHVGNGFEGSRRFELQRSAHCISHGKAEKTAPGALFSVHCYPFLIVPSSRREPSRSDRAFQGRKSAPWDRSDEVSGSSQGQHL